MFSRRRPLNSRNDAFEPDGNIWYQYWEYWYGPSRCVLVQASSLGRIRTSRRIRSLVPLGYVTSVMMRASGAIQRTERVLRPG